MTLINSSFHYGLNNNIFWKKLFCIQIKILFETEIFIQGPLNNEYFIKL